MLAIAFFCCSTRAAEPSLSWTHFAGMPPPSGSVDSGGTAARFYSPTGLATTPAGDVYVADSLNHTIRVIDRNGVARTLAGVAGRPGSEDGSGAAARFALPSGVALLGDTLYVADRLNHAIRRVTLGGAVSTFAGGRSGSADGIRGDARFNDPTDLRADSGGTLYVTDRLNHTIRRISPDGTVSTLAGRAGMNGTADGVGGAARFDAPDGIALDGSGNIYVADTNNHAIRRVSPDGSVTTVAGAPGQSGNANGRGSAARFSFPNRVMVYPDGRLLVSDTGNDCLRVISTEGDVTVFAGVPATPGALDAPRLGSRFYGPTGVALLPDGVVVADSLNHTVRKIGLNDQVTILAGAGGNFGPVDGPPLVARFNRPIGIAVHGSGDLYVTDTQANAIRRVAPDGTVTTVASGRVGEGTADGPAGIATLNAPHALAVAPDRTVFFCEQQRHTIRVLHPDGAISTLAGLPGASGSSDGIGASARFHFPSAIARDAAGNLFVADTGNHTIRRIDAGTAVVSTIAGQAGASGTSDGAAANARFSGPQGVVVDAGGSIYVADTGNHAIRRIRAGAVTTVVGLPAVPGFADGSGTTARFWNPTGLELDRDGRLYVADTYNQVVRRIANGVVATIGGRGGVPHYREGPGTNAFFFLPNGVAVDPAGAVYVLQHGNNLIMKGELDRTPRILSQPQSSTIPAGGSLTLSVRADGGGLSYQWKFNGNPIPGATSSTWTVADVQPSMAGGYSVDISNSAGTISSEVVAVSVTAPTRFSRIVNLSILSPIGTAAEPFTIGFVVGGTGTNGAKPLVIRAAGPSLSAFGVEDRVSDPRLELYDGPVKAGENDNWGGSDELAGAMAAVGAFPFAASTSLDAAARATVSVTSGSPRNNSVRVASNGDGAGRVLAEIYDATSEANVNSSTPRLINVSVLKEVGSGFTAGFVIRGNTTKQVLIRGVGPGLAPFGITSGFVADPQITLYRGTTELRSNNDWDASAAAAFERVGAFALSPGSKDAALLETLPPGDYTVSVFGRDGSGGLTLVEVYEVP